MQSPQQDVHVAPGDCDVTSPSDERQPWRDGTPSWGKPILSPRTPRGSASAISRVVSVSLGLHFSPSPACPCAHQARGREERLATSEVPPDPARLGFERGGWGLGPRVRPNSPAGRQAAGALGGTKH